MFPFSKHKPPEESEAATTKDNRLGLTVLSDPGTSATLDIIAVHGLTGHALGTWTHQKSQKLWLKEFLPHDIEDKARVMTFGYDTSSFTKALKSNTFVVGEELLNLLLDKRIHDVSASRTACPFTNFAHRIIESCSSLLTVSVASS